MALATAANGRKVWACYVVGLDPTDPLDDFRITAFWMEGDVPKFEFNHTTDGSGNSFLPYVKPLGKAKLTDGWRMPTDAEFAALLDNCTTAWITTNGVNGRLVTGKGAYADKSIFLPAAGYGYDSILDELGSFGYYLSSTPTSDIPERAWSLNFLSDGSYRYYYDRCFGRSVRPVRGLDE